MNDKEVPVRRKGFLYWFVLTVLAIDGYSSVIPGLRTLLEHESLPPLAIGTRMAIFDGWEYPGMVAQDPNDLWWEQLRINEEARQAMFGPRPGARLLRKGELPELPDPPPPGPTLP